MARGWFDGVLRGRIDGLYLLLLGSALFLSVGFFGEFISSTSMQDFKSVYYGARCLLQHGDPYNESQLLHVYLSEGGEQNPRQAGQRAAVASFINLPTTTVFAIPFAMLPWGPAHALWMILTAGSFMLACYLMWELDADRTPLLSGFLICFLLASSASLLMTGNAAGIVIGLCVIAVWCFLKDRFALAGVICLAISLAIKPHDAGLVWLYFLLAGGVYRKRALQALGAAVALGLPAILWVWHGSPFWIQELHTHLVALSARGNLNDPGPAAGCIHDAGGVINLQSVISIFRDDPRIYNPVTYLICFSLLLIWSAATLRSRFSPARTKLALAAIAPLTMLVTYHRPYDAKLLLLAVPACAVLCAQRSLAGWLALAATITGIVATGDYSLIALANLAGNPQWNAAGVFGKTLTVALTRPVPLILLAACIFPLWVYVRHCFAESHEQAES
jgi:hypothetical protein